MKGLFAVLSAVLLASTLTQVSHAQNAEKKEVFHCTLYPQGEERVELEGKLKEDGNWIVEHELGNATETSLSARYMPNIKSILMIVSDEGFSASYIAKDFERTETYVVDGKKLTFRSTSNVILSRSKPEFKATTMSCGLRIEESI